MTRMSIPFLCACAAGLMSIACDDKETTLYEISLCVSGIATDSVSGVGLDSVAIAFDDTAVVLTCSDSAGSYRYITGGRLSATVYAMKPGYHTKSAFARGPNPRTGGAVVVDFQLAPE